VSCTDCQGSKGEGHKGRYDQIQDREVVKRSFNTEWGTANVMGDETDAEMEWNEPFFRDCFDLKIVTWVSRKKKSFTRFQMIK
jgi:hypothetical protein